MNDGLFEKGDLNPYDEDVIDSYVEQISIDLDRVGALDSIRNSAVLDVGSGRQALAFAKLTAKSIQHYDISEQNVRRLQSFVETNNISITTQRADISSDELNEESVYDFIYLQGVIQHVKDPHSAIFNLARSCKVGGVMWLYHYQCGSPVHIYAEAAREIIGEGFNLENMARFFQLVNLSNKKIGIIMDDMGCTYRYLLRANFYKEHMEKYGFEQFYRKDIEDDAEGLDIERTSAACIGGYKKSFNNVQKASMSALPESVDHFEPKNYLASQRELIDELRKIKERIIENTQCIKNRNVHSLVTALPLLKEMVSYRIDDPIEDVTNSLINSFSNALYFSETV